MLVVVEVVVGDVNCVVAIVVVDLKVVYWENRLFSDEIVLEAVCELAPGPIVVVDLRAATSVGRLSESDPLLASGGVEGDVSLRSG